MEALYGIFTCPKCNFKGMDDVKLWTKKEQYNKNNKLVWKYILYSSSKSYKKWVCFSICEKNENKNNYYSNPPKRLNNSYQFIPANPPINNESGGSSFSFGSFGTCIITIIILPFYLLFFIWIDIYHYCNNVKIKFENVQGIDIMNKKFNIFEKKICKDIWKELGGLTEQQWNQKKLRKCPECGYNGKSITDFIPNSTNKVSVPMPTTQSITNQKNNKIDDSNITKTVSTNENNGQNEDNNDYIIFNLVGELIFPVRLKKTERFLVAEQKLLARNSDLIGKKLIYLYNGLQIDKNKTIDEIGIKNEAHIVFNKLN